MSADTVEAYLIHTGHRGAVRSVTVASVPSWTTIGRGYGRHAATSWQVVRDGRIYRYRGATASDGRPVLTSQPGEVLA